MAILLAHTKANAIVSDFLYGFLASYRRKEGEESEGLSQFNYLLNGSTSAGMLRGAIISVLESEGQTLVFNLLAAITGAPAMSLHPH